MPLSGNPDKRAQQLANLRRGAGAPEGNDRATKHGRYSGLARNEKGLPPGISRAHRYPCTGPHARCRCSYKASAYDSVTGRVTNRSFPTLDEAIAWRSDRVRRLTTRDAKHVGDPSLERAYGFLRRALQEVDRVDPPQDARPSRNEALRALSAAEDALGDAIRATKYRQTVSAA